MQLEFLHDFFYNVQLKIYNCKSTDSKNRKIWVDIPAYIIFPCKTQNDSPVSFGDSVNQRMI